MRLAVCRAGHNRSQGGARPDADVPAIRARKDGALASPELQMLHIAYTAGALPVHCYRKGPTCPMKKLLLLCIVAPPPPRPFERDPLHPNKLTRRTLLPANPASSAKSPATAAQAMLKTKLAEEIKARDDTEGNSHSKLKEVALRLKVRAAHPCFCSSVDRSLLVCTGGPCLDCFGSWPLLASTALDNNGNMYVLFSTTWTPHSPRCLPLTARAPRRATQHSFTPGCAMCFGLQEEHKRRVAAEAELKMSMEMKESVLRQLQELEYEKNRMQDTIRCAARCFSLCFLSTAVLIRLLRVVAALVGARCYSESLGRPAYARTPACHFAHSCLHTRLSAPQEPAGRRGRAERSSSARNGRRGRGPRGGAPHAQHAVRPGRGTGAWKPHVSSAVALPLLLRQPVRQMMADAA